MSQSSVTFSNAGHILTRHTLSAVAVQDTSLAEKKKMECIGNLL